jgi:hypothetical protein
MQAFVRLTLETRYGFMWRLGLCERHCVHVGFCVCASVQVHISVCACVSACAILWEGMGAWVGIYICACSQFACVHAQLHAYLFIRGCVCACALNKMTPIMAACLQVVYSELSEEEPYSIPSSEAAAV